MKQSKHTKRALTASIFSMLLCVALLIGSTFAWFTDSVTSGRNRITAGNLDVNLAYTANGSDWNDVNADTTLFKTDTLWEPGHMEVAYLKVENLGSLALQYQLGVTASDTVVSTNVNGEELRLSQYLEYAVVDMTADSTGSVTLYNDRNTVLAALTEDNTFALDEPYYYDSIMYPASAQSAEYPAEKYIALIVYMPEDVGNEANYRTGENPPEITLGVTLNATQVPYENDSFGSDYDAGARFTVSNENELDEALSNAESGSIIMLDNDITISDDGVLSISANDITVDMQGHTIDVSSLIIYGIDGEDNIVIQNGTITSDGIASEYASGVIDISGVDQKGSTKVTLNNIKVDAPDTELYALNFNYCESILDNVTSNGRVNFTDGFGVINGGNYTAAKNDEWIINSNFGLEVNGGSFTAVGENQVIFNVAKPSADTSFTINDGVFNYNEASYPIKSVNISRPATYIKINGGTFNGTAYSDSMFEQIVRK